MAKKEHVEVVSDPETDDYDSESDVTEDEDGLDLTPALDAAILRTLGKIRRGEGVYNAEKVLEEELAQAEAEAIKRGVNVKKVKKEQAKPYLLADHHRAALLSGQVNEPEDDDPNGERAPPMTYAQEERKMRKDAIEAFKNFGGDGAEDDEDDFAPVKREQDEDEQDEADAGYRQFLLEMGGGEDEVRRLLGMGDQPVSHVRDVQDEAEASQAGEEKKKESEKKKQKRLAKKRQDDDSFLMDYILNRGWVDQDDTAVPTYDEITATKTKTRVKAESDDEDDENQAGPSHPWGVLEEDEFDEKAEEFETQYNFRYEEPGAEEIASHPRSIPSLVRRPDDTRKLKREARAERKAAAAAAKEEEMRKQKGSKRREMESQLSALRKEIGEKQWQNIEKVLEGDFDEDEWERVVGEALAGVDDDAGQEQGEDEGDEKPSWDDDDEAYGNYEEEGYGEEGGDVDMDMDMGMDEEEGPVNMDADFIGFDEAPSKKKSKKDKKKGKKAAQMEEEQLVADEDLTVAERAAKVKEAMTEYKALDHEDMIGDLPTRFHYTQTAPTAFGLSAAEILMATDEELNAIMSVKHIAPYRRGGLGVQGKGLGKRVKDLKTSLEGRKWGEESWTPKAGANASGHQRDGGYAQRDGGEPGKKKRAGKNERKRKAAAAGLEETGETNGADGAKENEKPKTIDEQRRALELDAAAQTVQGSAFRGGVHPSRMAQVQVDASFEQQRAAAQTDAADDGEDGEGKKKRRKKKKGSKLD